MNVRFLNPIKPPFLTFAVAFMLSGCAGSADQSLEEFTRWHESAKVQAQAGVIRWSELYKESFDRLTALPPSLQQDAQLEKTVMLLSAARQFEAQELTWHQFTAERESIEQQLQNRLQ